MGILLDKFDKLFFEAESAVVHADQIAFLREQLQALEKQVEMLEAENARLKQQPAENQPKSAAKSQMEEFVEHQGALFKRKPEGGYHLAVYCPRCHNAASTFEGQLPYHCTCGWMADFWQKDLERILTELPK